MTRLFIYIALSLAITGFATFLMGLPGSVSIEALGYRMQPGLGLVAVGFLASILVAIALWAILRRIIEAPRRLRLANLRRKRKVGVEALSDGFIALEAGDPQKARVLARSAQERLPENAAAQLLEARADLALADFGAAREHYKALISNPKTALAALSGLFEQARAQKRPQAALTFARKALTLAPRAEWAFEQVLGDLAAKGNWAEALEMVSARKVASKAERSAKKRLLCVLNSAIALGAETHDSASALTHAEAALKLEADFVPAALISARTHAARGEARRAASLLRRVWRATSHPQVATLYAHIQSGSSAVDRLKRVRDLIGVPTDREAALVVAQAAADAYEWALARTSLKPYLDSPTRQVCLILAEIEEGQDGDLGKAREWLARAVKAPGDHAWVADGVVREDWMPLSPVTGRLDQFVWQVPGGGADAAKSATSIAPAADTAAALPVKEQKRIAPLEQ